MEAVRTELLQQLQDLQGAPSVAMQQVPPPFERRLAAETDDKEYDTKVRDASAAAGGGGNDDDDDGNPDERPDAGARRQHSAELYDKVD